LIEWVGVVEQVVVVLVEEEVRPPVELQPIVVVIKLKGLRMRISRNES
jgi:hypothetical protein